MRQKSRDALARVRAAAAAALAARLRHRDPGMRQAAADALSRAEAAGMRQARVRMVRKPGFCPVSSPSSKSQFE